MNECETNKRRIPDIQVIEDDTFSFSGFQVVRGEFFSHIYEPSFTLNQNKIYVNTACIRKMPEVEYVQVLVHPEEKKLIIRPCAEEERDSFRWKTGGKKPGPKQVGCKIFFAKIIELMKWNHNYRYKLLGKLIKSNNELLFVFNLNNPEIYERVVVEGDKAKASRIPVYPEEWKNQFGVSMEEHQRSLSMNTFSEYTIFGVKTTPKKIASTDDAELAGEMNE